jgi:hypothetical protein
MPQVFIESASLVKDGQREPGEVLLEGRELRVELGKLLEQVRQSSSRGTGRGVCCDPSPRVFLRGGTSGKIRQWPSMQARHFQEVFLCHTSDACIGRVGNHGQMSRGEPVAQGFGMNAK